MRGLMLAISGFSVGFLLRGRDVPQPRSAIYVSAPIPAWLTARAPLRANLWRAQPASPARLQRVPLLTFLSLFALIYLGG